MCAWTKTCPSTPPRLDAAESKQILRNIIAERVLSLPGDVRVGKDLPFNAAKA